MPLMIKLNRNIVRVDLCLDNGHFITVFSLLKSLIFFENIPLNKSCFKDNMTFLRNFALKKPLSI